MEEPTNPELDWRELLNTNIQSVVKNDFTFMRPAKKGIAERVYLSGMDYDPRLRCVHCFIDSSGSMSDPMLQDLLGEVKGCMEQYSNFTLRLFPLIHRLILFMSLILATLTRYMTLKLQGGGGTEFDCMFDLIKEEDIVPRNLLFSTDGYPWGSWGDESYCDTLFIIQWSRLWW